MYLCLARKALGQSQTQFFICDSLKPTAQVIPSASHLYPSLPTQIKCKIIFKSQCHPRVTLNT